MKASALFLSFFALSAPAFADGGSNKLIGGRNAPAGMFPASVVARSGGGACTGTVVGPRTVFLAAHCMSNNGTVTFSAAGQNYSSRCTHAPGYRSNATADWALCLTDRVVTGIEYEVVNTDAARHKVGQELLLTGYGCVRAGGSGGNDGQYRIGEAKITSLPSGSSNNDIVTNNGAALCFGDSGGPAFLFLDAEKTVRVVTSINSRGDIQTTSYLSSITTPTAKQFVASWMQTNAAEICGVSEGTQGCRHSDEEIAQF